MGACSGPNTVTNGLVYSLDVSNPKGINASSCVGYNNAKQLVNNLVNLVETSSSSTTIRLGNLTYYTAFAIDYPESSYGGAAASRQGLTQGFNVTSGSKTYDASRALHLWVWNNATASWVADSFFTGYRLAGHCYDTYAGADAPGGYSAELGRFVSDYNRINAAFPDCTYIVAGSHRDSYRNDAVRAILLDLGMPAGTTLDSNGDIGAPEWILIGKPGLGSGNGGWVYENYSTNPNQVAHMNLGLPFKGNASNYLDFNGSSDYINANWSGVNTSAGGFNTVSMWVYWTGASNGFPMEFSSGYRLWMPSGYWGFNNGAGDCYGINFNSNVNTWKYVTSIFYNGAYTGNNKIYVNGVDQVLTQLQGPGTSGTASTSGTIGNYGGSIGSYPYPGRISHLSIHNRQLSAAEVMQSFNATRGRYGV